MKPPKIPRSKGDSTNNGPRPRVDRPIDGPQSIIDLQKAQVSFDAEKFDFLIRTHGVRMIHQRALPDPRGMASRGDNRDSLNIRPRDSDGYIYKNSGYLHAWFHNNSRQDQSQDLGELISSSVYMTVTRFYDETREPVILCPWDRFYLADIEMLVSGMQFMEASATGIDRLQFPVVKVIDLIDANGEEYTQDKDFVITDEGWLRWVGQRRPGYNPKLGKETVYAVRYYYTPFFVVDRILHEIRVTNVTDPATYERRLERMPFEVMALRENIFMDKNRSDPSRPHYADDPRTQMAPDPYNGIYPAGQLPLGTFGAPPKGKT